MNDHGMSGCLREGYLDHISQAIGGSSHFCQYSLSPPQKIEKKKEKILVCENVMLKCVFGIPLSSESLVCVDTPKRAVRLNMEMARKISVRNPRKTPVKKENPKRGGAIHLRILSAFGVPRCTVLLDSGQQKMSGKIGLCSKKINIL